MVRNAFMVVSISDLGSWLVAKAVSRLVRRFRIRDRLICGSWEPEEGRAIPAITVAYVRVGPCAEEGGGWTATVTAGWRLVESLLAILGRVVSCAFDASWRVTAASGVMAKALAREALDQAVGF
ncbi:hypothetical protein QTP88_003063 [Uroleucon formosanum]